MTTTYNLPLSLTSQVAFCSMPLRLDTYRGCPFQCRYCFAAAFDYTARQRESLDRHVFEQVIPADPKYIIRVLAGKLDGRGVGNFLKAGQPLHWGGVSDPFSYSEPRMGVSLAVLKYLAYETDYRVIVSTKSTLLSQEPYHTIASAMKDRLMIQTSLIGAGDVVKKLEPAAPGWEERTAFIEHMAGEGFNTLIRIQPYIPTLAATQASQFARYGAAGVRGVVVEGLKIPARITTFVRKQWADISRTLGYDVLAAMKHSGRNTGGDYEYSFTDKLAYVLTLRELAHQNGLSFYAADNDMRLLGDSPHCCATDWIMPEGAEPWNLHLTALAYRSPADFGAAMLPDDDRLQTSLDFLNGGSAAGHANLRAIGGRIGNYLRRLYNDPVWVRRIIPSAEVSHMDSYGTVHYRINPAFLTVAEQGRCGMKADDRRDRNPG